MNHRVQGPCSFLKEKLFFSFLHLLQLAICKQILWFIIVVFIGVKLFVLVSVIFFIRLFVRDAIILGITLLSKYKSGRHVLHCILKFEFRTTVQIEVNLAFKFKNKTKWFVKKIPVWISVILLFNTECFSYAQRHWTKQINCVICRVTSYDFVAIIVFYEIRDIVANPAIRCKVEDHLNWFAFKLTHHYFWKFAQTSIYY